MANQQIGEPGIEHRGNGPCEEASMFSSATYIACGAPATKTMYSERDETSYRMCNMCADHNTRRGMVEVPLPWHEYFFTFGSGYDNHNKYVRIFAPCYATARSTMFEHYGEKWAFQYDAKGFAGQPEQFRLTELEYLVHQPKDNRRETA